MYVLSSMFMFTAIKLMFHKYFDGIFNDCF